MQNYINFVFVDPPFDPQYEGTSFILSKKRRLLRSKEAAANSSVDSQFPFKQAECVHTCLADDYRFVDRHSKHEAALPGDGAFTVPVFDLLLADAAANGDVPQPEPQSARRAALDIGPFTFPNLQSKAEKFDAAVMQLRTTIQNFLNLRLRSTLTPFAAVSAVSRFGTQIQQRLTGRPVEIQFFGACYNDACTPCCLALTRGPCSAVWLRPFGWHPRGDQLPGADAGQPGFHLAGRPHVSQPVRVADGCDGDDEPQWHQRHLWAARFAAAAESGASAAAESGASAAASAAAVAASSAASSSAVTAAIIAAS